VVPRVQIDDVWENELTFNAVIIENGKVDVIFGRM
jgi:hypothetical protein